MTRHNYFALHTLVIGRFCVYFAYTYIEDTDEEEYDDGVDDDPLHSGRGRY